MVFIFTSVSAEDKHMKGEAAFQVGLAYQRAGDHSTAKKVPKIVFDSAEDIDTAVTQRREQSVINVGAKGKENRGLGERGENTTR